MKFQVHKGGIKVAEYLGIDVSKYQGQIDWNKVAAAGYKFAFVRLGWCNYDGTITEGLDPFYATNMKNAIAAGIDVGVYVYSYAKTTAAAQVCAKKVLEMVKPYKLTMPIAWDYEDSKTYASLGKATNNAICKAFLDIIQQANYYAILYTYTSFINAYLDWSGLTAYDKWIADYRGYCGYTGTYSIWQYSSNGSVDGISGRCDMNKMYKDLPSLIKERGLNGFSGLEFTSLSNYKLVISEDDKREYFNSASIYDVAGKLKAGEYKAIAKSSGQYQGFDWCKFEMDGKVYYTVLGESLSSLVKGEEIQLESVNGIIHVLENDRCEFFNSPDVNDVVGKMPVADYKAIQKSVKAYNGYNWATFASEGKTYFVALIDGLSTLEIIKEPDPVVEKPVEEVKEPVDMSKYIDVDTFNKFKDTVNDSFAKLSQKVESNNTSHQEVEKEIISLKASMKEYSSSLKEATEMVKKIEEWITTYKRGD